MTSLHSQLLVDLGFPAVSNEFGETVLYTPPSGEPVTFTAPFAELPGDRFERAGHGEKAPRKAVVECPNNQAYDVDGTFTVGADVWRVDKIGARDAAQITIYLKLGGDIQFDGVH